MSSTISNLPSPTNVLPTGVTYQLRGEDTLANITLPDAFDSKRPPAISTTTKNLLFPRTGAGTLRLLMAGDPRYGANVRTSFQRLAPTLYDDASPRTRCERFAWVPFLQDESMRKLAADCANMELRRASRKFLETLTTNTQGPTWDIVIIGAGPHGIALAHSLRNSGRRVLIVDQASEAGNTFASIGDTFYLNSANRAGTAQPGRPGQGNLNPLGATLEVPHVTGTRWPCGRVIAELSAVNLLATGFQPLFNVRVTSIKPWDGSFYTVVMNTARNVEVTARAKQVVVATGLGIPRPPSDDVSSNGVIDKELAYTENNITKLSQFGIATVSQALRLAKRPNLGRDTYRNQKDQTITTAVIGRGDSAKVFLEFLFGLGPSAAYRFDNAQLGGIGPVEWIVGPDGPSECVDFVSTVRARYSDLSGPLKSKANISLNRMRLLTVTRIGNGGNELTDYILTYEMPNGMRAKRVVQRVILATGFDNRVGEMLGTMLPGVGKEALRDLPSSPYLVDVIGNVIDADGNKRRRPVAKALGRERVYLVGPAAGKGLVASEEVDAERVPENLQALFGTLPRTQALAATLDREPRLTDSPPALKTDNPITLTPAYSGPVGVFQGAAPALTPSDAGSLETLRWALAELLDRCMLSGTPSSERLTLNFAINSSLNSQIEIRSPDLNSASLTSLGEGLRADLEIWTLLYATLRDGLVPRLQLTCTLRNGRFLMETLRLS